MVCDGQTQTTPTIHKTFFSELGPASGTVDLVQMTAESCIADSSKDDLDLDSNLNKFSSESVSHADSDIDESASFIQHMEIGVAEMCKCPPCSGAIMGKLVDLQKDVKFIASMLKSGDENSCPSEYETFPPPRIPPPPPLPPSFPPSSPIFGHSVSLHSLSGRKSVAKVQCDEMSTTQDRCKPIITLEEIQKVKLRQVSNVANVKHDQK